VLMPALQPIDLWAPGTGTGRLLDYGDNLFRLKDRHGREQALGPTHEEVVTTLFGTFVNSYKDLPKTLYQIQTKFRDEFRPRFGVLRSREFQMKDSYSFHLGMDGPGGLDASYEDHRQAYHKIFRGCGIEVMEVEAEAGPVGGNASHEFMCPSPTGEDTILVSNKGNYAANVEKCETGKREVCSYLSHGPAVAEESRPDQPPTGDLTEIHTPDAKSIEELCEGWKKFAGGKLEPQNTLKTLVFQGPSKSCGEEQQNYNWIVAVIRGDHELNEAKLKQLCGDAINFADADSEMASDLPIGYVGPHIALQLNKVWIVVDPDVATNQFWVAGANRSGYHVSHFHWQRDLFEDCENFVQWHHKHPGCGFSVADIRNATAGDPSPLNDGGILDERKGIELGHIFKLGDKYTKALNVTVADENNQPATPIMGCYGIGLNRILAAAIENPAGHDDSGIVWPVPLAPYTVLITPIKYEGEVKKAVDQLASDLEAKSIPTRSPHSLSVGLPPIDVLIDDRDERPGPKFKDADLIGIPVRITIGDKGLAESPPIVELKARDGSNGPKGERVPVDQAVEKTLALIASLLPQS